MRSGPPPGAAPPRRFSGGLPLPALLVAAALLPALAACSGGTVEPEGSAAARRPPVAAEPGTTGAEIRFSRNPRYPDFGTVSVVGLPPKALSMLSRASLDEALWISLFPVTTGEILPADGTHPGVLGTWSVESEGIRFTPRFALATGIQYTARFDGALFDALTGHEGAPTPDLELTFSMPDPDTEATTVVEAVYPSAEVVPENLLRLYIHFSAPMAPQIVTDAVRLYDASGERVELPFVEVPEGLWDPSHRRLTVIFHPGRLKRGVGPHEVMGTPLREGGTYRLVVGKEMKDAQGYPLAEGYERRYRAGPADRVSPNVETWELVAPDGPSGPVILNLPEPLDHALMLRLMSVVTAGGSRVLGAAEAPDEERRWRFMPERPWNPGRHAILVDPAIEDLAGNTPRRLFDVETRLGGVAPEEDQGPIRLEFVVPR